MGKIPRGLCSAFVVLAAFLPTPRSDAIVMRHDRDEKAFVELARRFPATVSFHRSTDSTQLEGMGTLIDPRWVLTAAHVADHLKPGAVAAVGGATHEIDAIVKHPDWRGFKTWDDLRADVALIRLRTAVMDVVPARIFTGSDEARMTVTFVGRGSFGTGLTGPIAETRTMRAATNRVEKVEVAYLQFRFDAPGDPGVTPLEGISGEGDSGGPAYVELDGVVVYVVGVSSAQDSRPAAKKMGHYGVLEFYPRVSHHAGWIRATISARRR